MAEVHCLPMPAASHWQQQEDLAEVKMAPWRMEFSLTHVSEGHRKEDFVQVNHIGGMEMAERVHI